MICRRIIPCLDVADGRVVKGVRFQSLRDAGDPIECAIAYQTQGADELVFLDISATLEGRSTQRTLIAKIRQALSIPFTTGGGVREAADAGALLDAGADKVSINTAALQNPAIISEIAERFGAQCTVIAIDATRDGKGSFETLSHSGKKRTGVDVLEWAKEAVSRGAGEILLTSFDRDGTRSGYDLDLLRAVSGAVSVPVIASGGAASPAHLYEAIEAGADAVLAASIFHDGEYTVGALKDALRARGVPVRL